MLRFSGVAVSHVGLVRGANEDSGFLGPSCMLVADGVGGNAAGEVASATAAYVVSALALAQPGAEPLALLRDAVRLAQEQVAAGVRIEPTRLGMATTLTAVLTDGQRFGLAHLGDSRGYVLRDGHLTRVTQDHTFVQRLVDQGTLDDSEAARHPLRNVVVRVVNGNPAETGDVSTLGLVAGDRVLLASDGLTDLVGEPRIEELMGRNHDDAAADGLLDAALVAGGRDNVTCLVATVVDAAPTAADGVLVGAVRDPRNIVDAGAVRASRSA